MRKLIVLGALLLGSAALADDSFAIKIDAPPSKKAQKATAKIHISPGTGYHVNKDYPTSLKLAQVDGVTVEKPTQKVEEAGADFEVAYTATAAGQKTFTGEVKFAVCSKSSCDPKRQPVTFTVEVK
jgi:hypothetical protein